MLLILVYVFAMVVANLTVYAFGPWFSPINSFILIGLDLTLRDVLHERLTKWQMFGVICTGAVITLILNPGAQFIAIASATAFGLSAIVDWAVYASMHKRPWMVRSNASNVAGAAVDSVVFPTLAFGVFMPQIILMQFAAKVGGGYLWSLLFSRTVRKEYKEQR